MSQNEQKLNFTHARCQTFETTAAQAQAHAAELQRACATVSAELADATMRRAALEEEAKAREAEMRRHSDDASKRDEVCSYARILLNFH